MGIQDWEECVWDWRGYVGLGMMNGSGEDFCARNGLWGLKSCVDLGRSWGSVRDVGLTKMFEF